MAPGIKTGGRNFEIGYPGGPGRPHTPEDIKEARELTRHEMERLLYRFFKMKSRELHSVHTSPDSNVLELIVARFVQCAINDGNVQRFALICDRILGPVPRPVILENNPENPLLPGVQSYGAEVLTGIMLKLKKEAEELECNLTEMKLVVSSEPSQASSPQSSPQELDLELSKQKLND